MCDIVRGPRVFVRIILSRSDTEVQWRTKSVLLCEFISLLLSNLFSVWFHGRAAHTYNSDSPHSQNITATQQL